MDVNTVLVKYGIDIHPYFINTIRVSNLITFQELTTKLEVIQARLLKSLPENQRLVAPHGILKRRATLLIGPRGVGKTIYLLNLVNEKIKNAIYISLDNPLLSNISLYEYGDWLFQNGYEALILDEVHCAADWSKHLKGLHDAYPEKKIIVSDSSALILKKGLGDLSRRFVVEPFPYLSFREFLYLKYQVEFDDMTFEDYLEINKVQKWFSHISLILKKHQINLSKEFKYYLNGGVRPFFLEGDYENKLTQILEKVIHQDIPYFLPEVKERHFHLMNHTINYLLHSQIPTLNVESLATKWSISKPTVYNLLSTLEASSVISIIKKKGNISSKTKGSKIFLSDVSTYSALQGLLGNQREAYFCMQMKILGKSVFASKDESHSDFEVDHVSFEIGGSQKKAKHSDLVLKDNFDEFYKNTRPLWSLGFINLKK